MEPQRNSDRVLHHDDDFCHCRENRPVALKLCFEAGGIEKCNLMDYSDPNALISQCAHPRLI